MKIGLVPLLLLSLIPSLSHSQIFVLQGDTEYNDSIGEYSLSGAAINSALISGLEQPGVLVANNADLFVTTGANISKYATSGALINAALIYQGQGYGGLALDGNGYLYATDGGHYSIMRFGVDSGGWGLGSPFITGLNAPTALTFSGNLLYVANSDGTQSIATCSLLGGDGCSPFIFGVNVAALAVDSDGGHVFVANSGTGTVSEYTTTGQVVNLSLISGLGFAAGLALDGRGHLFVSDSLNGTVGEYTTTGDVINASLLSGLSYPTSIDVVPEPSISLMLCSLALLVAVIRHRSPVLSRT